MSSAKINPHEVQSSENCFDIPRENERGEAFSATIVFGRIVWYAGVISVRNAPTGKSLIRSVKSS